MQAFSPHHQYTHSSIKCVTDEGVSRLVSDFVSIRFDYRNDPTTSQELFTYEVCQFLKYICLVHIATTFTCSPSRESLLVVLVMS